MVSQGFPEKVLPLLACHDFYGSLSHSVIEQKFPVLIQQSASHTFCQTMEFLQFI